MLILEVIGIFNLGTLKKVIMEFTANNFKEMFKQIGMIARNLDSNAEHDLICYSALHVKHLIQQANKHSKEASGHYELTLQQYEVLEIWYRSFWL